MEKRVSGYLESSAKDMNDLYFLVREGILGYFEGALRWESS